MPNRPDDSRIVRAGAVAGPRSERPVASLRYRSVLFDVGETLLGPRESFGATYARVLAGLGLVLAPESFEAALRETWAELSRAIPVGTDRYRHFEDGERGYWLRFARATIERASGATAGEEFVDVALERLRDAFRRREAWIVYDDVFPTLDELRSMGVRLGIVSNWDSRLPHVLQLHGLDGYFEAVAFSHDVGFEKPHPEIFRRALAKLGGNPREFLHVGDVASLDVEGARAAGIDAVLIDRRRGGAGSEPAVSSLAEIPSIVRETGDRRRVTPGGVPGP